MKSNEHESFEVMGKPAPMDDDVLELTRKCAKAIGLKADEIPVYDSHGALLGSEPAWLVPKGGAGGFSDIGRVAEWHYNPSKHDHQAFELLCWLSERGTCMIQYGWGFQFVWDDEHDQIKFPCTNPTELRLALMMAVCRVKEEK